MRNDAFIAMTKPRSKGRRENNHNFTFNHLINLGLMCGNLCGNDDMFEFNL